MRAVTRFAAGLTSSLLASMALLAPAGVLASAAGHATAMQSGLMGEPGDASEEQLDLLRDFTHFVAIARYDVAEATARALLESGIDALTFTAMVERSGEMQRFERAVAEAQRVPVLEDEAAALDALFRQGKLDRARDPAEIARNIELLTGDLRARQLARERLVAAGEYAMPQLLDAFLQNRNPALKAQVQNVMVELGRQAVIPLSTAMLGGLDAARQEAIAEVLGLIRFRTALPFLADLRERTEIERVRQAAGRSIASLLDQAGANVNDVAGLYTLLAGSYYDERPELTSFAGERHQLMWGYDPGLGLTFVQIETPVYHEAMAMRLAERSLELDADASETVALWIASNYSREIDQPEGYENPEYPSVRRDPAYYGVASGTDIAQRVLRRAIDDGDTPLAMRAVGAIQATAGPSELWSGGVDGRVPLLEALRYPNRRVQYEAAIALGMAQPSSSFDGSDRVVPLLAGAVRDASARYAVVLTGSDRESYARLRGLLEGEGYSVLPPSEGGLNGLDQAITETPGIDMVVVSMPLAQATLALSDVRERSETSVAPVLAMLPADEVPALERRFRRDATVAVRRFGLSDDQIATNVGELLEAASGGPISGMEASAYADRSLSVLRDLAVSGNSVLDVADAAAPLISVMEGGRDEVLLEIADVLSHVGDARSQSAVFEQALDAVSTDRQLALLELVGASGKRFGSMLDRRQLVRLFELARDPDDEVATTAAGVIGSLGLENERLVPVILEDRQVGGAAGALGGG